MSKYLIYTAPGIGDFVIAAPLIRNIKEQDPSAIIDLFTCSDNKRIGLYKTMADLQGDVRNCYYYTKSELIHSMLFLMKAGYHAYDYGIVLEHSNTQHLSSWPSKIVNFCCKATIGARNPYINANYTYYIERPEQYHIYDLENDILEQLNMKRAIKDREFYMLDQSPNVVPIVRSHPSVVFCIGSNSVANEKKDNPYALSLKSWPTQNWVELANELVKRNIEVILIGGSIEAVMIDSYKDILDSGVTNFIGQHSIKESFQVIREADFVVGVDTGLIHAASIQGTATLTLFGATDPKIVHPFGPYSHIIQNNTECSPCLGYEQSYTCTNNRCMQGISLQCVLNSILDILKK